MLRRILKIITFILIIAALAGWFIYNNSFKKQATIKKPTFTPPNSSLSVKTKKISAKNKIKQITLYGITESLRKVDIKSEIAGKIIKISAIEGEPIKKNDIIAVIDIRDKRALKNRAKALLSQRKLEHKITNDLVKEGHKSDTELKASYTVLKEAEAEIKTVNEDIEDTIIKAPFDGILEKIHIEEGETIKERETNIATLLDYSSYIIKGNLPEKELGNFDVGADAQVRLINRQIINGKVKYIASLADNATRTFEVEIEVPAINNIVAEGMSAEITINADNLKAHLIPNSALTISSEGYIGIKIINAKNKVEFYRANIISQDNYGMWLSGLPDEITLITFGQDYVNVGDEITLSKKM